MDVYGASQVVLVVKNPPANTGDIRDVGLIPGWEGPLEEGTATVSSLENSVDRGTWQATGHGVGKSCAEVTE